MQLFREKKILQLKLQPELAWKQVKGKKENKLVCIYKFVTVYVLEAGAFG